MANNTSELNVTSLDFDLIKQELITYFNSDPTFQDYEFEGSALNILMDILAYNTHMNAVMANMSANEMFIDSAQIRQSVVSIAKALGYTPRSKRTALAVVDLAFYDIPGAPAYIDIPAGTRFSSAQGTVFSTKEAYLAYPDINGSVTDYSIKDVEIYEGVRHTFSYVVDYSNPDQKFIIPSKNADLSSLVVSHNLGSTIHIHSLNDNLTLLTPASEVYFLHENPNGEFEITFGDGILGKKPVNGTTIVLSYIISKEGADANGINSFSKYQQISGYSSYNITTKIKAYGAAEVESKESIAFNAPKMFQAQYRAVTTHDYENFMMVEYPFIESMSVWGGEYNDPPVYGKVFIAIKPSHTEFLSDNLKAKIKEELIKKYNVVTVIPEIVDPDYTYILIDTAVQYSRPSTSLSENGLSNIVNAAIVNYFSNSTEKFNKPFYFSPLTKSIDNSHVSIVNSLTDILIMKKFSPILGAAERRVLNFYNAIVPGTVESSFYNIFGTTGATSKQQIKDDGLGNLYTVNILTGETVYSSIGTVNYDSGSLEMLLTIYDLPVDTLDVRVYCQPVSKNILPGYNQILGLDSSAAAQTYGRQQGVSVSITAENIEYK